MDSGANTSYYLYSCSWYRTLSSNTFDSDSHASVIHVSNDGRIRGAWVHNVAGGVQSFIKFIKNLSICCGYMVE